MRKIFFVIAILLTFNIIFSQDFNGFALYNRQNNNTAYLIDKDGNIAKTWNCNVACNYTVLLKENGNIVRGGKYSGNQLNGAAIGGLVQEIDPSGNVVWEFIYSNADHCSHHDITLVGDNVMLVAWEVKSISELTQAGYNGASAEIMVRNGGHDPRAPAGSAASYLCLGPGFSSACNTPFRRHKTWVHEGGISTPLVAHWPAGIAARGELRRTPSHVIDIVPTILDVLEIKKPESWKGVSIPPAPGKSLLPAFSEDLTIQRDSLWWFHEGNRAIRVGDFKLVAAKNNPWELYDLSDDRAESNNLITHYPAKAADLKEQWEEQVRQISEIAILTPQKKKSEKKGESKNRSSKTSQTPSFNK